MSHSQASRVASSAKNTDATHAPTPLRRARDRRFYLGRSPPEQLTVGHCPERQPTKAAGVASISGRDAQAVATSREVRRQQAGDYSPDYCPWLSLLLSCSGTGGANERLGASAYRGSLRCVRHSISVAGPKIPSTKAVKGRSLSPAPSLRISGYS